jgi:prepilin peptidase CpaA
MDLCAAVVDAVTANWPVWFVTVALILAAVIDGFELKVPNWLTLPMIISGWIFSACQASSLNITWYSGLGWSLLGTAVGLGLLLPLYAIGGMGAGDVKLLAGVGAWMHATHTAYAFAISTIVGALLAILMVAYRRAWKKHASQFWMILNEVMVIKDPNELSRIASDRKSSMLLLPYGIPIAIGTIAYFAYTGMLTKV